MTETLASGVAGRLMPLIEELFGGFSPVALRTWDGGFAGPAGAPVVVLRSPQALRQLLWSPGELGLARAYVTGDLDVEGDLADGFRRVWASRGAKPGPAALARALRAMPEVLGPRPPVPASEARLRGRRHTRGRDSDAVAHHDLSNEFYELILDPSMAYSCARWAPGDTLVDAQRRKLDLVCRKLNLRRGDRLLDVGCGWGSMILYAAREYGARATGVTVSREQRAFIRTKSAGVEVRLQDYRDITGEPYDAISSIEMGEHVGEENYPAYAATLFRMVKPGGRVVVQQRSRGAGGPGGGPFIERYIAPDTHLRPVGQTVAIFEEAGFEAVHVESMREDYARTAHAWHETFEHHYDRAVALVGAEVARVWRLHLVGGGLAFEQGRMGVHQITLAR
jgi:cyclopropane-fatty-acyl-phospholipid synthase